jgi:ribosome-associated translation inhibitor RaiA
MSTTAVRSSEQQRSLDVQVRTVGPVPSFAARYAARKVGSLARLISRPVLSARVRLTQSENRSVVRPAIAQGTLDVNGRVVRAHVASATMREAVDALEDRLRDQLDRLLPERWDRTGPVGRPPRRRAPRRHPDVAPRPAAEREIVRRKTVATVAMTADEAADDLELLDVDFYLFRHLSSGQDAVLYRVSPLDYRLATVHPAPTSTATGAPHLTCSTVPPPRLTVAEAADRLDHTGLAFVFFADAETGRGAVLYQRYDGHYGLISCG